MQVNIFQMQLTQRETEILEEVTAQISSTSAYLAGLPRKQRLDWLREHQYTRPISFEREIDGTLYSVNTHFNGSANETVEERAARILNAKSSL